MDREATDAKTREILDFAEAAVRSAMQKFLGREKPSREDMERTITDALLSLRGAIPGPKFDYEMVDVGEGLVSLKPKNLYTGLIMAGVPHEEAKAHADSDVARLNGGRYFFTDRGDFVFQPDKPIEFITVTLRLGESGDV